MLSRKLSFSTTTKRSQKNNVMQADEIPSDILPSYSDYGCRINAISPLELFGRYRRAGFLYPAKMERLAPFLPLVEDNWRKAMRAGELLLFCVTHEGVAGEWASVSSWRSTSEGWQSQHLVSIGNPLGSRAVMLSAQAVRIHDRKDHSCQNWFRPENRFPARVFGTLTNVIAAQHAAITCQSLLAYPPGIQSSGDNISVTTDHRNGRTSGLFALAEQIRGHAYAKAEDLNNDDVQLDAVDQLYSRVGLRRFRRIWLAHIPGNDGPVGAALAYRGPLGLNFSFLENRCDLLISPTLTESQATDVATTLMTRTASIYQNFEPGSIPVVTDDRTARCLQAAGAALLRRYCQSVWLYEGFIPWYRHIEKFYERMLRSEPRRGLGRRLSMSVQTQAAKGASQEPCS